MKQRNGHETEMPKGPNGTKEQGRAVEAQTRDNQATAIKAIDDPYVHDEVDEIVNAYLYKVRPKERVCWAKYHVLCLLHYPGSIGVDRAYTKAQLLVCVDKYAELARHIEPQYVYRIFNFFGEAKHFMKYTD